MESPVPSRSAGEQAGRTVNRRRVAVGVVAQGRIAIGIVAMGGVSIGIVALGGIAIGVIALGGVAIGGMALGGITFGWRAVGAMAFGLAVTQVATKTVLGAACVGWPRLRGQATAQQRRAARKPS